MRLLYTVAAGILVLMVAAPALGQSQITTGVIDGVPVNKDSVQFASLAGFFRDEPAV